MFKSTSREREDGGVPAPASSGKGMFSVIGGDVVVTGNLAATADLHIDGRIEGDVACGALVQGCDSVIVGGVTAESARLAGSIDGSVRVRQLHVERSARIAGDVEYEAITIENGARVDGHLRHKSKGSIQTATATVTPIGRVAELVQADAIDPQQKLLG